MNFKEWNDQHNIKVTKIMEKINDKTIDQKIEYFSFENMVKHEPDFCPLYKTNTKCHEFSELNCYYCGCPYFKMSDDVPIYINNDIKVMSICSINAKDAKAFIVDGIQQCDCSNCIIPHKPQFIKSQLK